jgi:hypothetical protein
LDTDESVDLEMEIEVNEGWAEIEVWDYDFISRNDLLGAFRFNVDHTKGDYSTSMIVLEVGSHSSYILFWEIV